ncbi:MAG: hypothetical protein R2874_00705 [Desulfobacterales bacterium]
MCSDWEDLKGLSWKAILSSSLTGCNGIKLTGVSEYFQRIRVMVPSSAFKGMVFES